jgi:hypothetical protein
MTDIRDNIQQNLRVWERTLQERLLRNSASVISQEDSNYFGIKPPKNDSDNFSKVVLYGRHIWHCLHILLFGTMDFVEMYKDLSWQASADFVQAGEHAISCAKVSSLSSATSIATDNLDSLLGPF